MHHRVKLATSVVTKVAYTLIEGWLHKGVRYTLRMSRIRGRYGGVASSKVLMPSESAQCKSVRDPRVDLVAGHLFCLPCIDSSSSQPLHIKRWNCLEVLL